MPRKQPGNTSNHPTTWHPTPEQRRTVEALHAFGVPVPAIAQVLGIHENTLKKHCKVELETALVKANAKIAEFLYAGIIGTPTQKPFADERNRLQGAMFWLKCRAGWKEVVAHEIIRPVTEMTDEEIKARLSMDDPERGGGNIVPIRRGR